MDERITETGSLAERAEAIARRAHEGQVDKAGSPYIHHPERVVGYVARHAAPGWLDQARAVAWLHDVVEDTGVTLADLRAQFPAEVVAAVDAMTRRPGEGPYAYYARVRADPIALAVKHADLDDNTDSARLALLDAATAERLIAKYAHARATLGAMQHQTYPPQPVE
ncbi:HD domain-containing protein [Micrococcus sp.]|uniref:HD domain-containing protein n=1 Tax=Micrococcus sp. TaxID=1271 RepID=UPI0026DABFEE|nr:HD domain-containing protein [Micrococcus sp.]MDO4239571.1 HD domain-containing protein [Micrococcus sp.]